MSNIAIIIQGPSTYVSEQKKAWEGYLEHCFFSTWKGEEHNYTQEDNVIYNDFPQDVGLMNFNCQVLSTLSGLRYAKNLGYTRALKIRSDLIPTNYDKFLQIIDNDHFNFLSWMNHKVHPNCKGYLLDYLMSGCIDDMLNFWSVENNVSPVPEVKLTFNYIEKISVFKNREICYFLNDLNESNDLYWIKRRISLISLKNDAIFSNDKQYLNNEYINFLK